MKNKILAYLSKNKIKYNKIDDRKYEILFPKEGDAMTNKSTKELLIEFMATQSAFNKNVLNRLDGIDNRLENIVKKNNLLE